MGDILGTYGLPFINEVGPPQDHTSVTNSLVLIYGSTPVLLANAAEEATLRKSGLKIDGRVVRHKNNNNE